MKPDWVTEAARAVDMEMLEQARAHQNQLTKPPGALGQLEELATKLASLQGRLKPSLEQVSITVFAGDHGVADEQVSAFPQAVTAEMVRNFAHGGAAICVLARQWNAHFEVVNLGTVIELPPMPGVRDQRLGASTANFCVQPAMSEEQLAAALVAGSDAAERALEQGADLFIGGEMGIANTTAAAALSAALLGSGVEQLAGPGTGVDAAGVAHKVQVIEKALALHGETLQDAYQALRCLGGFEIAALAGAYIRCAQLGMPALVDGFITTAAALAATRLNPSVADWLLYSHASAEPGHQRLLAALEARPLLNIGMRLGEGSGAALLVPLLRSACALHAEMATFAQAEVSEHH